MEDELDNSTIADAVPLAKQVEKTRTRQKSYALDLRIHSPASLGYLGVEGLDPAPALVRLAKVKGLDVIGITDYYSGDFIDRICAAAKDTSVTVIPGVTLRCAVGKCDDVVLTCLFPEVCTSSGIASFLSELGVPRAASGADSYLVQRSLQEIMQAVDQRNGIAIPSQMDKTPHRMEVIPRLVDEFGFRAFDLAFSDSTQFFKRRWPKTKFQLFSFSNAKALAQVGSRFARLKLPTPDFASIRALIGRSDDTSKELAVE